MNSFNTLRVTADVLSQIREHIFTDSILFCLKGLRCKVKYESELACLNSNAYFIVIYTTVHLYHIQLKSDWSESVYLLFFLQV